MAGDMKRPMLGHIVFGSLVGLTLRLTSLESIEGLEDDIRVHLDGRLEV